MNSRANNYRMANERTANKVLAISAVVVIGLLIGCGARIVASDKSANSTSKTQGGPKRDVAGSDGGPQQASSVGADQTSKSKVKQRKPKPPPFDVPTAVTKIDSALKEANAAKSISDWGAAFQSTVNAWEIARHYRDDAVIKPKLAMIEVALEELGKKANALHELSIKSRSTVHFEK